jgi:hypothetical protein
MFQKGNQFGKGRPKVSLSRPELLLPIIFQKASINWANDFCQLYKKYKAGPLSKAEAEQYKMYLMLLPYLCSKVQLKDLDAQKFTTPEDSKAIANQTAALLKALEASTDGPNPTPARVSKADSVEARQSSVPPTSESKTDL